MNTLQKIVGINLIILVTYSILVSIISVFDGALSLGLMAMAFLPIHIVMCLFAWATVGKKDREEKKLHRKAHLISALIVLIVGFSVCSGMFLL